MSLKELAIEWISESETTNE